MESFVEDFDFDHSSTGPNSIRESSEEIFGSNGSSSSHSRSALDLSLVPRRRKPMPRKGHTKSRRGCFTCKKRKIKCQETHPMCGNCEKAGMTCEYPSPPTVPLPAPIMQPQSTPTIFSIKDMQFFHHFLIKAYPHLPVGADQLWTIDVPSFAHKVCPLLVVLSLPLTRCSTITYSILCLDWALLILRYLVYPLQN
jgi:hypothetical protein